MAFFVMARTIIKSLCKMPVTRGYPFGARRLPYKNTRGRITIDIKKCIFCGTCQKKCPSRALTVVKEEKRWIKDPLRCISCGCCVESCPKNCLFMEGDYLSPVVNKEKEVYQNA